MAKILATVHLGDVSVDIHSGADAETTAMLLTPQQYRWLMEGRLESVWEVMVPK